MSVQLVEAFKGLNFKNYGSFLKYDMFNMIFELSKNFSILDPIPEGSIHIYSQHADLAAASNAVKDVKIFTELLQCGTKPLDAIAFVSVFNDAQGGSMHKCFVHTKKQAYEDNQFEALSVLAATVIVFVSRGAFPSGDGIRGKTPLPKLVQSMLKGSEKFKCEKDLLDHLCSFDTKHVNTQGIFKTDALVGWDPILVNRLNLGVAGHKPLKLASDMANLCVKPLPPYVQMLVDLYARAKGGFYPKLHPSDASFSLQYKGFYAQSLAAVYDSMVEDKREKALRLSRHPAFLNEKLFRPIPDTDKIHLDMIPRLYTTWEVAKMKMEIGQPMEFATSEYKHVEPIKVDGSKKHDPSKAKTKKEEEPKETGRVGEDL